MIVCVLLLLGIQDSKDARDLNSNTSTFNRDGTSRINNSPSPFTFWYRMNKLILRLCSIHRFKNLQVR